MKAYQELLDHYLAVLELPQLDENKVAVRAPALRPVAEALDRLWPGLKEPERESARQHMRQRYEKLVKGD